MLWNQLQKSFSDYRKIDINPEIQACVALVLKDKANPKLLMIKRATRDDDPWSGHYGLPGGVVEKDEDLIEAVVRENREELSLDLEQHQLIGGLDQFQVFKGRKVLPFVIHPFVYHIKEGSQLKLLKEEREVEDYYWLEIRKLFDPNSLQILNFSFGDESKDLPALVYDELRIWGITYKILESFQKALFADHSLDIHEFLPDDMEHWIDYPR